VLGCAFRGSLRRPVVLGHTGTCVGQDRVGPVALSGVMAAFASERCGIDTGTTEVIVRRLSDGRPVSASAAATVPGAESYTTVSALRVRSDGAVAWIALATSLGTSRREIEVRAVDARGMRLLDSGLGIGIHSLRLAGAVVSWTDAGGRRSARLA
jgi:hypothetical protein